MKLKPAKCRSFSITSGTPNDMNFDIHGTVISTIFHEEPKFLGKVLFLLGKSKDTFIYLKSELLTKLENIKKINNQKGVQTLDLQTLFPSIYQIYLDSEQPHKNRPNKARCPQY